ILVRTLPDDPVLALDSALEQELHRGERELVAPGPGERADAEHPQAPPPPFLTVGAQSHPLVQLDPLVREPLEGELGLDPRAAGAPHPLPETRVGPQLAKRCRGSRRVARRDEEALDAVPHRLARTS